MFKDIAPEFKKMLIGAMKELCAVGQFGPVIDAEAYRNISNYIEQVEGRVLSIIRIAEITVDRREVRLEEIVQDINATGYGLTFRPACMIACSLSLRRSRREISRHCWKHPKSSISDWSRSQRLVLPIS